MPKLSPDKVCGACDPQVGADSTCSLAIFAGSPSLQYHPPSLTVNATNRMLLLRHDTLCTEPRCEIFSKGEVLARPFEQRLQG